MVGVLRVAGVDLHLAGVERLERVGEVVPSREGRVAGRQLGVGGNHAEVLLASERLLAKLVPALVELALVLVGPFLADVVRGVAAAGREVREERLVRVLGADRVEPLDGAIRHGVREVERILFVVVLGRRADDLLVLGQARVPLARATAEEPVEVVEAPSVGPPVERSRRTLLAVGGEVPLPEGGGAVAVLLQDPGQRRAVAGQRRRVARETPGELAHGAEAHGVAVASRQQRGARRRAECGDVEPVVAHATLGDAGVVRRVDRTAERARVPEAGVVDEHQEHVGRALGRRRMTDEVPVGLRSVERLVDHPGEHRPSDREMSAIDFAHHRVPSWRAPWHQRARRRHQARRSRTGARWLHPVGVIPSRATRPRAPRSSSARRRSCAGRQRRERRCGDATVFAPHNHPVRTIPSSRLGSMIGFTTIGPRGRVLRRSR